MKNKLLSYQIVEIILFEDELATDDVIIVSSGTIGNPDSDTGDLNFF